MLHNVAALVQIPPLSEVLETLAHRDKCVDLSVTKLSCTLIL